MNATDPVCGMNVDTGKAAATEKYGGQSYYFCSAHCHSEFKTNPARYAGKQADTRGAPAGHGGHCH